MTHRVTTPRWIQAQKGAGPASVVTTQELKMPMLSSGRNGESARLCAERRVRLAPQDVLRTNDSLSKQDWD